MYGLRPERRDEVKNVLKVMGKLLRIAGPMGASYTFSASIIMAGWLASHVPGEDNDILAASNLIMAMLSTLVSIAEAPAFAVSIYTNYRRGQLEAPEGEITLEKMTILREEISGVLKAGMMLTAPNVIMPMLAMYFSKWTLADVFGQDAQVAADAQDFLRPYAFGLPAVALMRMSFEQILFGYEQQNMVMASALCSFALGVGVAYGLCFGSALTPAMGVKGAAYGLLIEAFLTPVFFAANLVLNKKFKEFNFFSRLLTLPDRKKDLPQVIELAQSGVPILLTTISQVLAPFTISALVGQYDDKKQTGTATLAVLSFSSWLAFGLTIPMLALGQAVAQETNRRLGQEQQEAESLMLPGASEGCYKKTIGTAYIGLGLTAMIMTAFAIIPIIWPEIITRTVGSLNKGNQDIVTEGEVVVQILAVGMVVEAVANTMAQTLRPLRDGYVATGVSVAGHWAGVLLAYFMAFSMDWGAKGFVAGPAIASGFSATALLWRFIDRTQEKTLAALPKNDCKSSISSCWRHPASQPESGTSRDNRVSSINEARPLLAGSSGLSGASENGGVVAVSAALS